ncbi:alkylphosphonate utilization protein, partial [Candidatus Gracilibacteria bacterium]|nr:alkylphosphonate utilization protein [Candidatus Gracilibacteria bacterium]
MEAEWIEKYGSSNTKKIISNLKTMSESLITVDAFGNTLNSGDSVQLTQQLDVKGTKISLKKGTKVKNI